MYLTHKIKLDIKLFEMSDVNQNDIVKKHETIAKYA